MTPLLPFSCTCFFSLDRSPLSFPPRPPLPLSSPCFGSLRFSSYLSHVRLVLVPPREITQKRLLAALSQARPDADHLGPDENEDSDFLHTLGLAHSKEESSGRRHGSQSEDGRFGDERRSYWKATKSELQTKIPAESEVSGGVSDFMGRAQSRIALLSEAQPSRLHNKVSVFERVTEPKIALLTSETDQSSSPEASSSTESAAFPRKYPRSPRGNASHNADQRFPPMNHEDFFPNAEKTFSPMRPGELSRNTDQGESLDDISKPKSPNFNSKLQMILNDFKKRGSWDDQGSKASGGLGRQFGKDLRSQGPKPRPNDFLDLSRKDIQTSEEMDLRFNKSSATGASQSGWESEGRTLANQIERHTRRDYRNQSGKDSGIESEAGPSSSTDSFNLFANTPPVPTGTSQRSRPVSPRRLSRSIGSRSSPSRSSIPGKYSKYSMRPEESAPITVSRSSPEPSQSSLKTNMLDEDTAKQQSSDDSYSTSFSVKSSSRVSFQDSSARTSPESRSSFKAEGFCDSDPGNDGSTPALGEKPLQHIENDTTDNVANGTFISTGENSVSLPGQSRSQSEERDFFASLSDSSLDVDATYSRDDATSGVSMPHVTKHSTDLTASPIVDKKNHGAHGSFGPPDDTVETPPVKNHPLSDLPFEFQYSYSEAPKAPIIRQREQFSPFGPTTMSRPWTGKAPLKPSKKKPREFDSFKPPPRDKKGIKYVQDPGPYPEGQGPKPAKTREEILGEPLTRDEVALLVDKCNRESRQVNLGRDGLTHNMLDLIHTQWKRRRVCRVKCLGVPTVDMDNVCFHVEDKTGGKIIHRHGGVLYVFRGRNYNYKDRPHIPLMLWKPAAPVYPKLIQPAPGGLALEQAQKLRAIGRKLLPICKLGKNGVYLNLVQHVRNAFKVDDLVRINCQGLNPSDYKKIGAKLKDLVPCVLLSFEREHLLLWKGKESNVSTVNDTDSRDAAASLIDRSSFEVSQEEASSALQQTNYKMSDSEKELLSGETSDCDISTDRSFSAHEDMSFALDDDAESDSFYSDAEANVSIAADSSDIKSPQQVKKTIFEPSSEEAMASADEAFESAKVISLEKGTLDEAETVSERPLVDSEEFPNELQGDFDAEPQGEEFDDEVQGKEGQVKTLTDAELKENGQVESLSMQLTALWQQAIESGMAADLDESDLDTDSVLKKAGEIAKSAPPGPVYTRGLLHRLKLRNIKRKPDEGTPMPLPRISHTRPKRPAKRVPHLPTVEVPPMGGLPVDELAKLLAR